MAKYIFITGGVVSSLGKGIAASSIGALLKNRGIKVFIQKFDPYINVDPGTMSPYQHGEVFVTDDGAETDLDLGHYERFIDENLTKESNITSGKIYQSVINKERRGEYLGKTVQVIPHITNEIKKKLQKAAEVSNADVIITEIGGTVGDIESLPFLEAIRQWRREIGVENTFFIHNTLVPYLRAANEIKTKPTQHSVKELREIGIQPDMIILRTEVNVSDEIREKIALFCDVYKEAVVQAIDVKVLYDVILNLHKQHVDDYICRYFKFPEMENDISKWVELTKRIKSLKETLTIGLVGKYVELHDAYLSIVEALKHAGYAIYKNVNIKWVLSEDVTEENVNDILGDVDGILVPGGFGSRGIEGKIVAIKYARVNRIPFLGICLGMQLATIEFAKNVIGYSDASSIEFDPNTTHPIIHFMSDQSDDVDKGGTLRLGLYDCTIKENTKTMDAYQKAHIKERHRHRYEFNNDYRKVFEENGMTISGINEERDLVEIIELKNHPFFIACQFHPEFLSRPLRPHPLFLSFITEINNIKEAKK